MRRHVAPLIFIQSLLLLSQLVHAESITTCYGETLSIGCSEDSFILVNFAAFGVFGTSDKCSAQSTAECWVDSTYFVSAICTGHHFCQSKVQYSHDLSSKSLRYKCAGVVELTAPRLFVQYLCIISTLLSSIQDVRSLDADHVGGFLATHDYQLSVKTPEWKTDLSEEYCTQWNLPSVISIPAPQGGLGIVIKLRDIGELYRPLSTSEDDFDVPLGDSYSPQKPVSKGGLLPPPPAFHCPSRSVGTPCLSDYLRMDVTTTATQHRLRLEVCPYASSDGWGALITNEYLQQPEKKVEDEDETYYGFASAVPGTSVLVFGPAYNFTSIDFEVNLQLGGAVDHTSGGNATSIMRHGWVKGLLFEYILLYCPPLPDVLEVGGHLGYALHTHTDATGATVAVAEIGCLPDRFVFPFSTAAATSTSLRLSDFEPLKNRLVLQCDHHRRQWIPDPPPGGCMTREEINAVLKALLNSKTTTIAPPDTTEAVKETIKTTNLTTTATTTNTTVAAMTMPSTTSEASVLTDPLKSPSKIDRSNSSAAENASLSHGSSAAMGAIFGFILCLLILLIVVFIFRQRLLRTVRSKLVTSNTLPGRFPGSGMFMNTLSGSLTFSRHRKNPYFSPSRHPTVIMSQSAVSIPHHPQHWLNGSSISVVKPTSAAVSLGNLHASKPSLSRLPPPSISSTQAASAVQDAQQQPGPPSSVTTPNSTSLSTQRQTLLSADTVTTNVSAGQPSPTITMGYCGASADRLAEGFTETPDVNQVFSATLPWKSKPQGGVAGGLKRLSTFIRSAMSGSSASFNGHHSNHGNHHQQTMATPGAARRKNFAGPWPSASFASSPTSTANSVGLFSSAQSRSSYTSDVTIQPIPSPLGSLGRSSLGQIPVDRKAPVYLVDSSMCHLNNQQREATTPTNVANATLGGGARRGMRKTTPLPPLPPLHPHYFNTNQQQNQQLHKQQQESNSLSGQGPHGKTATLNMDTYLEPIDGVDSLGRSDTIPAAEDLSVTEVISGGTFSEDSDTGHQASWPSLSTGNGGNGGSTNAAAEGETSTRDGSGGYGESNSSIVKAPEGAPIAVSDPTVSLGDASFEEDTSSAADYFTYDEGQRSHDHRHDRVIRRPRLSPPSPRSRPLSEAMLSNHYYDKSELLNPIAFAGGNKGDESGDCLLDVPFCPTHSNSRPTSVGVYSNDDEDVEEDSSLYEAVDRRKRKVEKAMALPPPPPPPPQPLVSPATAQKDVKVYTSRRKPSGDGINPKYQRYRGITKMASINASTSTLIADLSPLSRSLASRSPSPMRPVTSTPHTVPYANLSNL